MTEQGRGNSTGHSLSRGQERGQLLLEGSGFRCAPLPLVTTPLSPVKECSHAYASSRWAPGGNISAVGCLSQYHSPPRCSHHGLLPSGPGFRHVDACGATGVMWMSVRVIYFVVRSGNEIEKVSALTEGLLELLGRVNLGDGLRTQRVRLVLPLLDDQLALVVDVRGVVQDVWPRQTRLS